MNDSYDINDKLVMTSCVLANLNLFYEDQHRRITKEWKKFIDGSGTVDASCVSSDILMSWKSCRKLGIDPVGNPKHMILKGPSLQKLLDENRDLLNASRPFLDQLSGFIKESCFTIGICSTDGCLLDVKSAHDINDIQMKLNWYPGVFWTETEAGNNIISTVLATRKPARIFGPQHYKKRYHHITASGAPVIGPAGALLGGIVLTGYYSSDNLHTLGMAAAVASAIENQLKAEKAIGDSRRSSLETAVALNFIQALISSIPEALIAIDDKGFISTINEKARQRFISSRRTGVGESLQTIFAGPENASFRQLMRENKSFTAVEIKIFARSKHQVYTLTCESILSPDGKIIGKILIFSEFKKGQSIESRPTGGRANFIFSDVRGYNDQFQTVVEQARTVSQSSSNVLILGESGTGKDIIAQAIHNASLRRKGPYVALNCAAIPRNLIASELFGYSEGAFTGSRRGGNQGKFELADGGTIFLDEIAETPLELQAVLLRVIEEKAVVRIGEGLVRPVDVRIISATNKNLIEEVNNGAFRKDLYYRLNVFAISIPPLRERTDDIPLLVETFVRKYSESLHKQITMIDKKIWSIFMAHAWPGNVRELQNVVERMINYAPDNALTVDLIPPEIMNSPRMKRSQHRLESPEESEKKMIKHLLMLKFRKNQIAERMNISRVTLFRKIKKYGLTELVPE